MVRWTGLVVDSSAATLVGLRRKKCNRNLRLLGYQLKIWTFVDNALSKRESSQLTPRSPDAMSYLRAEQLTILLYQ